MLQPSSNCVSHRPRRLLLLAPVLLALAGCAGLPGEAGESANDTDGSARRAAPTSGDAQVSIFLFEFRPKTVTIQAGHTVHWTNHDLDQHSIVSGDPNDANAGSLFDSGDLNPGQSFSYTFNTPGTYNYFCDRHDFLPGMRNAKVIVTP